MGAEIAQRNEWNHDQSLDWHLLEHISHRGVQQTIKELNELYRNTPALYEQDTSPAGFAWLDSNNAKQSIFSFIRYAKQADDFVIVISNLTPQVYHDFIVGVPKAGDYQVVFNTDKQDYFGSAVEVTGEVNQIISTQMTLSHGFKQSLSISLPGLATIYLKKVNHES